MDNVFAVESGCLYEGGRLDEIFSTLEKARAYVLKELAEKKTFWEESIKEAEAAGEDVGEYKFWDYSETVDNHWSNGSEYVKVTEREVK